MRLLGRYSVLLVINKIEILIKGYKRLLFF